MAKKYIVCVDDEKIVLDSLKAQLKQKFGVGYSYEAAECADEAIEIIEEIMEDNEDILLIVSDWLMPGMKGDEFLISVHKKYPRIKMIMLTGQADEIAVKRAYEQAALLKCIHKPWSAEDLYETIKSSLDHISD
ncbi:MAG: response regulator [Bacteroidetes bacterium]|nr:response regulator [Bacteroidota bacterium]MBU1719143.1 response regulator [Bacteroidota bacterium]